MDYYLDCLNENSEKEDAFNADFNVDILIFNKIVSIVLQYWLFGIFFIAKLSLQYCYSNFVSRFYLV